MMESEAANRQKEPRQRRADLTAVGDRFGRCNGSLARQNPGRMQVESPNLTPTTSPPTVAPTAACTLCRVRTSPRALGMESRAIVSFPSPHPDATLLPVRPVVLRPWEHSAARYQARSAEGILHNRHLYTATMVYCLELPFGHAVSKRAG